MGGKPRWKDFQSKILLQPFTLGTSYRSENLTSCFLNFSIFQYFLLFVRENSNSWKTASPHRPVITPFFLQLFTNCASFPERGKGRALEVLIWRNIIFIIPTDLLRCSSVCLILLRPNSWSDFGWNTENNCKSCTLGTKKQILSAEKSIVPMALRSCLPECNEVFCSHSVTGAQQSCQKRLNIPRRGAKSNRALSYRAHLNEVTCLVQWHCALPGTALMDARVFSPLVLKQRSGNPQLTEGFI